MDRSGLYALVYLALLIVVVGVTQELSSRAVRAVIIGGILLGTITISMYVSFRCPRCGKRFFVKEGALWQFHRECQHCGLEKYQSI